MLFVVKSLNVCVEINAGWVKLDESHFKSVIGSLLNRISDRINCPNDSFKYGSAFGYASALLGSGIIDEESFSRLDVIIDQTANLEVIKS